MRQFHVTYGNNIYFYYLEHTHILEVWIMKGMSPSYLNLSTEYQD